jgi:hypothetical protein
VSDRALQLTVDVPILAEICSRLGHIEARIAQLEEGTVLAQEWYTLRQAAAFKRGVEHREGEIFDSFYRTLCAKPWLRPAGGTPDAKVGGAQVWHRDTIRAWLQLTDEDLEAIRKAS